MSDKGRSLKMIRPPKPKNRSNLIITISELGVEPWLGRTNWSAVADELDATYAQVRGWYRRLCNWLENNNYTIEQYAEQETGVGYADPWKEAEEEEGKINVVVREFDFQPTFEEFLEEAQIDLDKWEVTSKKHSQYGGQWSWSVSLKPRTAPSTVDFEGLLDRLENRAPTSWVPKFYDPEGDCVLFPSIYDAHIEKLFHDGSGVSDTIEAYEYVVEKLMGIADAQPYRIKRVALVIGQDFGHVDNGNGTTTAGTPMDVSVGRKPGIDLRTELVVATVNKFLNLAPVDVVLVPGNHDRDDTYWLGKFIEGWFRDNQNVTVDNGHSPRKFYSWGSSLFMFTHGDQEKLRDLPAIMPAEAPPELWAKTRHREVFSGHRHSYQRLYVPLTEEKGVIIRFFPSLSKPDDWHTLKGFVGNNRGGVGLIYHEQDRLVNEFPVLI